LTLALAGGLGLAANNTYFFPYLNELGAAESIMGLALTIGTLSEIPVLFFGNRLLQRFTANGLLLGRDHHRPPIDLVCRLAHSGDDLAAATPQRLTFPAMWIAGGLRRSKCTAWYAIDGAGSLRRNGLWIGPGRGRLHWRTNPGALGRTRALPDLWIHHPDHRGRCGAAANALARSTGRS
jgi:hypothetical protein